jgi:hypothetical protein
MRKRFLNRMNVLLGAVSLTLAGCHSSKQAVPEATPRPMLKYGVPAEVIALYGVQLPENYEIPEVPKEPADSTAVDTVAPKSEEQEIIVTKYGIPASFLDR